MTTLRIHSLWRGQCPLCGPALYVWVQGCPRRCAGCANEEALDVDGPAEQMSPAAAWNLWRAAMGALVLSGGEPFAQAEGLADLCRLVRGTDASTPILVYTGYRLDELLTGRDRTWVELLRQIDVLVDGPYVQELQCDFPLAGSSNQRVFLLSERIAPERVANLRHANLQIDATRDGHVRLVGSGHRAMNMTALVDSLGRYGIELV